MKKSTLWLLDSLAIVAIVAAAVNAYGKDDDGWYVAQRNGICLTLNEEFPKARTPDEAWAKMTRGVEPEMRIKIQHWSPRATVFQDAQDRFPPLIMVKGEAYCQRVAKRLHGNIDAD
jgi:hypothetical protein